MTACPSTSPMSDTPCRLPDRAADHQAGHESAPTPGPAALLVQVSWATTPAERARWNTPKETPAMTPQDATREPYRTLPGILAHAARRLDPETLDQVAADPATSRIGRRAARREKARRALAGRIRRARRHPLT